MIQYNQVTAELMRWKKKLEEVETKRSAQKNALLTLISNPLTKPKEYNLNECQKSLNDFHLQRSTLLGKNHGQGWSWTSHFNWLWGTLRYFSFGLINIKPNSGSKLRQALSESIPAEDPVFKSAPSTSDTHELLEERAFSEDLFFSPKKALNDIHLRVSQVQKKQIKEEEIKIAIERVYAMKYRLSPELYNYYLNILFESSPKLCLDFFYPLYCKNAPITETSTYDVIENHFIAQSLLEIYEKEQTVDPNFYTLQMLIIILITAHDPTLRKTNPIAQLMQLDPTHQNPVQEIYNNPIVCGTNYTLPLLHLNTLLDKNPELHPLLIHFVRLVCEKMVFFCQRDEWWSKGSVIYDSFKCLIDRILGNKSTFFKDVDRYKSGTSWLNPYTFEQSSFYRDFKPLEQISVEIITNAAKADPEQLIENLAELQKKAKELSSLEKSWIFSRVLHVHPKLKHLLTSICKDEFSLKDDYSNAYGLANELVMITKIRTPKQNVLTLIEEQKFKEEIQALNPLSKELFLFQLLRIFPEFETELENKLRASKQGATDDAVGDHPLEQAQSQSTTSKKPFSFKSSPGSGIFPDRQDNKRNTTTYEQRTDSSTPKPP